MALILTLNSNHPTPLGLIADSLHLSLWINFSIRGITWSTMAGCLQFAIWLCVLFKAVLSKYQSRFPSGCLSVRLWAFNLTCQCQPEASSWSHIVKWLWLNPLILISIIGTHCFQLLNAMEYKIILLLPKPNHEWDSGRGLWCDCCLLCKPAFQPKHLLVTLLPL